MKFKNKLQRVIFLLLIIIPFNVFAYSNYIVPGGKNIGIEVKSKEIIVVGFYSVDGKEIASLAGFNLGDSIIKINDEEITSIDDMVEKINKHVKNDTVKITVKRNDDYKDINLKLVKDDKDVYKTGLYVKDEIAGIGTLTYIDPETNIFGALGHEIIESNTNIKIEVKDGKIFNAKITGVNKSDKTTTGEKKAKFNSNKVYGSIKENTRSGIYGTYTYEYDKDNLMKVGNIDDIVLGPALIRTVLDDEKVEDFSINIIKINKDSSTKNILFEISDEKLLKKANGIIKGMSGSPIIQNNMVIGAVTHAIVNDSTKGYGIFITTMLKEGDN